MSPRIVKIECDQCKKDLAYTSYAAEFYVELAPTPKMNNSGTSFAMAVPAPCGQHVFCDLDCLKSWLSANE